MISVTNIIKYTNAGDNRRTLLFRYEGFTNFWLRFFDTRREAQFLLCRPFYADLTPNVRHISWCLRSLSVDIRKNPTTSSTAQSQLQLNGRELNSLPTWFNVNPQLPLFQNPQILSPSLLSMTSSTLQSQLLSGVYYDNGDCHILCARA